MIQSAEDIRKALLLMESYIVLPCNAWAGQVKILESEIKNSISSDPETYYGYKNTIFFITDEEYENYKQEAGKMRELNKSISYFYYKIKDHENRPDRNRFRCFTISFNCR